MQKSLWNRRQAGSSMKQVNSKEFLDICTEQLQNRSLWNLVFILAHKQKNLEEWTEKELSNQTPCLFLKVFHKLWFAEMIFPWS